RVHHHALGNVFRRVALADDAVPLGPARLPGLGAVGDGGPFDVVRAAPARAPPRHHDRGAVRGHGEGHAGVIQVAGPVVTADPQLLARRGPVADGGEVDARCPAMAAAGDVDRFAVRGDGDRVRELVLAGLAVIASDPYPLASGLVICDGGG